VANGSDHVRNLEIASHMTASAALSPERRWFIVGRWQEYEGEGRTNLLRVLAIAAFYANHLFWYWNLGEPSDADRAFHRQATLLAAAWVFLSLAVLVALQRHYLPAVLKYATTTIDLLLLTALAWLGDGPASVLVNGYFLVIAAAALRFSLPLVWCSTLTAMVCYLALVGAKDKTWFDADHATPVVTQLGTLLSLGLTGIVIGQVIRRVRHMAEEFAGKKARGT
jgi:hypothetical protein